MDEFLRPVRARSLVTVRAHMDDRQATAAALSLQTAPLSVSGKDPSAFWLAPNQWLFVSEKQSARTLIAELEPRLSRLVCLVTDVTPAFRCYGLVHPHARKLLSQGSGVDFESLEIGQCVRTRFAKIALIFVPLVDLTWELYVDISHAAYFESWIRHATEDQWSYIAPDSGARPE